MKAIGYRACLPIDDAQSLLDGDIPPGAPGPHDLRVAVRAVSVNPVDTKVRRRAAPQAGAFKVLGYDAAGIVESVGGSVTLFRPGDEVFYAGAINRPGCNSELHLVDERIVGRKPRSLSFAQAAALPLTAITAWELLFDRLAVARTASEPLLVVGGAGGVGSILIQLARKLTGLTVIATASRAETVEWCRQMGAHYVVDHQTQLSGALSAIGVSSVPLIASLTQTERHLPALVKLLTPQGRLALIDDPERLDVVPLKAKCASLHWEAMFARSTFQTPDMIAQHHLLNEVSGLVDAGILRTTLRTVLPRIDAAHLRQAHALIESGRSIGKVVLTNW